MYSFSNDAQALLRNRAYIDQMRADILRRAQEMELEDAEDEVFEAQFSTSSGFWERQGKGYGSQVMNLRRVKIAGNGDSDNEVVPVRRPNSCVFGLTDDDTRI